MKKFSRAFLIAIFMVPLLFWGKESSAIPVFARKYKTSCFTCHTQYPARNAFGEAFKNNGYRWPGGEDEEKTKIEQVKLGTEAWEKLFPDAPYPADISGIAPFSFWATGNLVNYQEKIDAYKNPVTNANVAATPEALAWGVPNTARILLGGTVGDNISYLGVYNFPTTTTALTTAFQMRAIWSFAPGVTMTFANAFPNITGVISNVLPAAGTGVEFTYATGDEGGWMVTAGVNNGATTDKLFDKRYIVARYKLFGAGLLSGAGGVLGNEYIGLDNSVSIGAGIYNSNEGFTTAGDKTQWGVDLTGNYGNFTAGVAYGQNKDLDSKIFYANLGYFIYPWMLARVQYDTESVRDYGRIRPSVRAYLRANVYLDVTYTAFTKDANASTGVKNREQAVVSAGIAF